MIVKGITIHNTGNNKSAQELYEELRKSGRVNLCHFLVDESQIIQTYPLDSPASHTGKGYDFGNRFTIAVEICRSQSNWELYSQAQNNAVTLIKRLMEEYSLTTDDIYFHHDFNIKTYCPHRILSEYGNKETFIREVF